MSDRVPLSVIVRTLNNGATLHRVLENISWANEIVVLDSGSWDGTLEIAKSFSRKIAISTLSNQPGLDVEKVIRALHNDWILSIDGNQLIPFDLKKEILHTLSLPTTSCVYALQSRPDGWGSAWANSPKSKHEQSYLFHRDAKFGISPDGIFTVEDSTRSLNSHLEVCTIESIEQWIDKMNEGTSLDVARIKTHNASLIIRLWKLIVCPLIAFSRNFIGDGLYRYGIRGFIFSVLTGIHRLSLEAKIWEYQMRESEGAGNQPPVTTAALRMYHRK